MRMISDGKYRYNKTGICRDLFISLLVKDVYSFGYVLNIIKPENDAEFSMLHKFLFGMVNSLIDFRSNITKCDTAILRKIKIADLCDSDIPLLINNRKVEGYMRFRVTHNSYYNHMFYTKGMKKFHIGCYDVESSIFVRTVFGERGMCGIGEVVYGEFRINSTSDAHRIYTWLRNRNAPAREEFIIELNRLITLNEKMSQ